MKTTLSEMENTADRINNRSDILKKKKINKLKDTVKNYPK